MKKTIKTTNCHLSDELGDYLDKCLFAVSKYVDEDDDSAIVDIEIGRTTMHHKSGDVFRAEANFHSKHFDVRVVSEKGDLRTAIDGIKNELENALTNRKNKRINFLRRSGLKLKKMLRREK